jgi:hypothetical protein
MSVVGHPISTQAPAEAAYLRYLRKTAGEFAVIYLRKTAREIEVIMKATAR